MIIDCHNHPDWHGHNLDKFLDNMRRFNIDITWLLSWECPSNEYWKSSYSIFIDDKEHGPIPFTRCISYAERAPHKFILGFAPDPRHPYSIDQLKASVEIYGVKLYGELKLRICYDNPDALRVFRECAKLNLPVIFHLEYDTAENYSSYRTNFWYGGSIEAIERAIQACPETIFIGHAPGFWAHISGDEQYNKVAYPKGPVMPGGKLISMLRKYPTLYCDLSAGSGFNALDRDHNFAKEFIMEFQDRILFGRDYFDSRLQELLNNLGLPKDVLEKIYSKNALKLVPLSA